jgi:outer membrane lipoprotein-sorting protein
LRPLVREDGSNVGPRGKGKGGAPLWLPCFLALALLASAGAGIIAAAQPRPTEPSAGEAVQWLIRATRAPARLSYRAKQTLVVTDQVGTRRERLRVVHRAPDDTRREYLSSSGKIEQIVVDDNSARLHWEYTPHGQRVVFSPTRHVEPDLWIGQHLDQLQANYVIRLAGSGPVDGRGARLLMITPRNGHSGPSKQLWAEEQSGLVLRSQLVSSDGRTRVTSELSELRLEKSISSGEFAPPRKAKRETVVYEHVTFLPLPTLARQWRLALIVPSALPRGYRFHSARLVRGRREAFVHLCYFDGLNTISLFESPSRPPRGKTVSRGAKTRVHGRPASWGVYPPYNSLTWREKDLKLVLVADLPRGELLRLAQGTKPFVE